MAWTIASPPEKTSVKIGGMVYVCVAIRTEVEGDFTQLLVGSGASAPQWVDLSSVETIFHPKN